MSSGARFGFFKNKTNAGVTATFPGRYPTWPTMPNVSVYEYFINSADQTADPVFNGNVNAGTFDVGNDTPFALPLTDGNALITSGQFNSYNYDYNTGNFSNVSTSLTFSGTGLSQAKVNKMNAFAWADNGNVDVFHGSDPAISFEGNTVYTYDMTGGVIRGFDTSNPFRGAYHSVPLLDGNVLLLRNFDSLSTNTYTGGPPSDADSNGNLPLCKYNPNTNAVTYLGNTIHYANAIAFGNAGAPIGGSGGRIAFPSLGTISRDTGNIYLVPGTGCIANVYTYQGGSIPTLDSNNMRQKCIIEHDPTNNVTTEHTPANINLTVPPLDTANMTLSQQAADSFSREIYSISVAGADGHIYAFPGDLQDNRPDYNDDIYGIKEHNAILRFDPDNLANCEQSTFGIYDNTGDYTTDGSGTSNANLMVMQRSKSAFLTTDGHITWLCNLRGPDTNAFNQPANAYMCWLDTNPTSDTYLTGGKTFIDIVATGGGGPNSANDWTSKNYAFTGGNVYVGGPADDPLSNIANGSPAAQTITASGTAVPATLYATWNRKSNGGVIS